MEQFIVFWLAQDELDIDEDEDYYQSNPYEDGFEPITGFAFEMVVSEDRLTAEAEVLQHVTEEYPDLQVVAIYVYTWAQFLEDAEARLHSAMDQSLPQVPVDRRAG